MDLPDNVIRHFLRDAYFLSGTACGGKSTTARILAARHDLLLYDADARYPQHKALSDPAYQPAMNATYASWDAYFNRPPDAYAAALRRSMHEQLGIVITELLTLAPGRRIIVDGMVPCDVLRRIASPNRVVFLMADIAAIRRDYLNRPDKADMRACLAGLTDPERSTENMFRTLQLGLAQELDEVRASGYPWFLRGEATDWNAVHAAVERHFGLDEPHRSTVG